MLWASDESSCWCATHSLHPGEHVDSQNSGHGRPPVSRSMQTPQSSWPSPFKSVPLNFCAKYSISDQVRGGPDICKRQQQTTGYWVREANDQCTHGIAREPRDR